MKKQSTGQAEVISKPVSEDHSLSEEIMSGDENEELTQNGLNDKFFELLDNADWIHLKLFDMNPNFKGADTNGS